MGHPTNWQDYAIEFEPDGSLRDIYVLDASVADWQTLIDFLRSSDYHLQFFVGGEQPMPNDVAEIFALRPLNSPFLSVETASLTLICHFFYAGETEFNLLPNEVKGQSEAQQIFDFMRQIGRLLNKEVVLTPENEREIPIFSFSPASGELKYSPVMKNLLSPRFDQI